MLWFKIINFRQFVSETSNGKGWNGWAHKYSQVLFMKQV